MISSRFGISSLSSVCLASRSIVRCQRPAIVSAFHSSAYVCNKKGGKGKKDVDNVTETTAVALPDVKAYDKGIEATVNWFSAELSKLKVGKVSPDLFNNLPVESYGTVGKAGQVTLKSNTKLVVSVFDPEIATAVADAIRNCGLNINPTIEGSNVMATIPRPSKESRDALAKNVAKLSEKAKQDVRNSRKNVLDGVKKIKSAVSEDDMRRFTKEVENITEKKLEKVAQLTKSKENEINSSE